MRHVTQKELTDISGGGFNFRLKDYLPFLPIGFNLRVDAPDPLGVVTGFHGITSAIDKGNAFMAGK